MIDVCVFGPHNHVFFFLEGALLFEGHALPKYFTLFYFGMVLPYPIFSGMSGGMADGVWCDLDVLVVFGVIWVFKFGGVWCDLGVLVVFGMIWVFWWCLV